MESKILLALGVLFLANFANSAVLSAFSPKIHPSLQSQLLLTQDQPSTVDAFISFKDGNSPALRQFSTQSLTFDPSTTSRGARIQNLVSVLQSHSQKTQRGAYDILSKTKISSAILEVQSFWITNQIFVKNANAALLSTLAALPEVVAIEPNQVFQLNEFINARPAPATSISRVAEWGIGNVEAQRVWEMPGGNAGEGARVATIDTGVRYTHETIRDNYLGQYGWFDPYSSTNAPNDANGHGTHTMGTLVGKLGVGVAPNATWMSCLGCGPSGCLQNALTACGQFVICPTLPNGASPDCSKAPHVVSNSWNGAVGNPMFQPVVDSWQAAGIIPVFSIGNTGTACGTASSPGDFMNVIGVGATDVFNALGYFSSVGPSVHGQVKPEISAPGVEVRSGWGTADNSYLVGSGTSMACPHVAGVIALMKSADPTLDYDKVRGYLLGGADRNVRSTGRICSGLSDGEFPNHHFGHGKVNAYEAVKAVLEGGEDPGTTTTRRPGPTIEPIP